jgi:hypothetical protein
MVSDEPGPGEVQDISGRRTQEPSKASGLIASRAKAMLPSQPPEGTVGPLNETLNPGELDLMEANRGPKEPPIAGRGPTQHVREPLNDNRMAGDFVGANSPKVRPSNTRASTTAQGMPTAVGVPAAKVAAAADDIWGAFNPKSRAMMPIPEQESTVSGASISRRSSDRGSVTSGRYQEQTSSGDVSPTVAEKRRRNEKQAAQLNKAAGRSPMHVADAATYSAAPGPPRPTNEPVTSIHRDPIRNVQSDTEPRKGAEASGTPDSTTDRIPLPTSLKAVGALSGAAQASPFSAQPLDGTASFGSSAHGNREASPARASSVDDLLQRASNRCDRLVYLCSQVEGSRAKAIPDEKVEHLAQRAAQEVRQLQVSLKQARLAEKTPELRAQLAMHQQDCEETLQKWERLFEVPAFGAVVRALLCICSDKRLRWQTLIVVCEMLVDAAQNDVVPLESLQSNACHFVQHCTALSWNTFCGSRQTGRATGPAVYSFLLLHDEHPQSAMWYCKQYGRPDFVLLCRVATPTQASMGSWRTWNQVKEDTCTAAML